MLALLYACVSDGSEPLHDPVKAGEDTAGRLSDSETETLTGTGENDPSETVFDPTRIHDVALTMSPADWAEVRDNPWTEVWVPAALTVDDETVGEIGVRAFGYGSVVAGKPSLKLSMDHFTPGASWRGLEQLKLDNSSQDFGFFNEFVATTVMREWGVPAARTGWARLTVNGDPAGFFVLLEPVDDRFLQRWFSTDDGALYGTADGCWGQGLNPFTGDPLTWFNPQTDAGNGRDLIELSELVASGSDAALAEGVDLPGFLKESVGRSVMGSIDCLSCDGNNYYLYRDSEQWRVIPWDFDVELGVWYMSTALAVDPAAPWASSPWAYNPINGLAYTDPLLSRQLASGADLSVLVSELIEGPLDYPRWDAQIGETADLIRDDVWADVLGYGPSFEQRAHDLRLFLHTRLSGLAGREVAECRELPAGGTWLSERQVSGSVGWGALTVDQTGYWGPGFQVAGEHFCRGFFAHSPSTITLTVPAGTLKGAVGLQDWNQQCGNGAQFVVEQDGRRLWESGELRNYDPAEVLEVVVDAGELVLSVDALGEYSCDTAVWGDVRVE